MKLRSSKTPGITDNKNLSTVAEKPRNATLYYVIPLRIGLGPINPTKSCPSLPRFAYSLIVWPKLRV